MILFPSEDIGLVNSTPLHTTLKNAGRTRGTSRYMTGNGGHRSIHVMSVISCLTMYCGMGRRSCRATRLILQIYNCELKVLASREEWCCQKNF